MSLALLFSAAAFVGCGDDSSGKSGTKQPAGSDDDNPDDPDPSDPDAVPAKKDAGTVRKDASTPRADASTKPPEVDAGTSEPDPDPTPDAGTTGTDPSATKPADSKLPAVKGTCPDLKTGMATILGATVQLTVGTKPGPMVFYWHGTGSQSSEVDVGLPGATAEIKNNGGIVASFQTTSKTGTDTGNSVWYTGDFDVADQILACGLQKGLVDAGRIYSSGYSAGGLQTGAMMIARSNYLASVVVYSGGPALGGLAGVPKFQDPSNIPPSAIAHGAKGSDMFILDFYDASHKLEDAIKAAGGFSIDCDDGGAHVTGNRLGIMGKAWQFLKDHPYNSKPDPYAGGLPGGWPSYCMIVK